MTVGVGEPAPALTLETTAGEVKLPDPSGRTVLLMFFQEAGTPACTTQVASLAAERELIEETGAVAVCVSTDPIERLDHFARTLGERTPALASDLEGSAARAFGVYDEEGKRAHRAAFVIDGSGVVTLAIPWYNPANSDQFASLFAALGVAG